MVRTELQEMDNSVGVDPGRSRDDRLNPYSLELSYTAFSAVNLQVIRGIILVELIGIEPTTS